MTNPVITPTGFPELFTFTLLNQLTAHVPSALNFTTRPVRPNDPNRTVAVVEGDAEPFEYEIAARQEPSMLTWDAAIQVYVKASNEIDGRNARRTLMQECRKALFLPTTVTALMTLSDTVERASSFRMRRLEFVPAEARDAGKQFHFLGQIALTFKTEHL